MDQINARAVQVVERVQQKLTGAFDPLCYRLPSLIFLRHRSRFQAYGRSQCQRSSRQAHRSSYLARKSLAMLHRLGKCSFRRRPRFSQLTVLSVSARSGEDGACVSEVETFCVVFSFSFPCNISILCAAGRAAEARTEIRTRAALGRCHTIVYHCKSVFPCRQRLQLTQSIPCDDAGAPARLDRLALRLSCFHLNLLAA